MRLNFQKRSELKIQSRIDPEKAKPYSGSGFNTTHYYVLELLQNHVA